MKAKAFIALFLAACLTVVLSIPASAASVGDIKSKLDDLKAAYPGKPRLASAVNQAKKWLTDNEDSISPAAADVITTQIGKAWSAARGATEYWQLSQSQIKTIIASVNAALAEVNHRLIVDSSMTLFQVVDSVGNIVFVFDVRGGRHWDYGYYHTGNPIKQTGLHGLEGLMAAGAILAVLLLGSVTVYLVYRRRLQRSTA